jgi:hypothetical protein
VVVVRWPSAPKCTAAKPAHGRHVSAQYAGGPLVNGPNQSCQSHELVRDPESASAAVATAGTWPGAMYVLLISGSCRSRASRLWSSLCIGPQRRGGLHAHPSLSIGIITAFIWIPERRPAGPAATAAPCLGVHRFQRYGLPRPSFPVVVPS